MKWSLKYPVLVSFAFLVSLGCFGQKKSVNAQIQYIESYCGGARPSEDMMLNILKPKPYANKKIFVVSATGKTYSTKTNAAGIFKIKLQPGTYKVMEVWRYNKTSPNGAAMDHFDKTCLKAEWEKECMLITITNTEVNTSAKNEIKVYCDWAFPCLLGPHTPPVAE